MEFLYSLYDALIGIHVPSDKARAVVDAMERDMGTTLATKVDLKPFATREDLREDIAAVRGEIQAVRQDLALLRHELDASRRLLSKDIEAMRSSIVIWLGSAIVVAAGVMFAAMRVL